MARLAALVALLPSLASSLATGTANAQDCVPGGPSPPEGWIRFANTSVVIPAQASTVWDLLADTDGWADWNDIFKASKIAGGPAVGKTFWISSYMKTAPLLLRRTSILMKLDTVEPNQKICWAPQAIPGIRGHHCYVLCPTGAGTRVYNYEDHKGMMQPITKKVMGDATTDAFAGYNQALTVEAIRKR